MARPVKQGLDYFPKDTDSFSDRKIRRLLKEFKAEGYLVYDYLRCLIYQDKGYYIEFNDELCFDVADYLECGITETIVKEIVLGCIKLNLFDAKLFNQQKILTSSGIQKRYLKIKRNGIIDDEIKVNAAKTGVIAAETHINTATSTQRKEKESKVKEIKVKETQQPQQQSTELTSQEIIQFSQQAKKDSIWLEQLCVGTHILPNEIDSWISQFNASLVGFKSADFTVNSYKRIFRGWLNKQQSNGYKIQHQQPETSFTSKGSWI